jgi:hypothetical protein
MTERTPGLTDEAIAQFLRTRSADPELGLLGDIVRTVGATPQDRPWLGLRPVQLPRRALLIVAAALLLTTMGAIAVGSGLILPNPGSPFLGMWFATEPDGGSMTMVIRASGDQLEIEVHDTVATVCSGTPSTMTGAGRLAESGLQLVIPSPVYTCDDGSIAETVSGPPLEDLLRNLTFTLDPDASALTDSGGVVWYREGAEPTPAPPTSGPLWPQTSLAEVRDAQERADAGDPAYTWQVDPELSSQEWWDYLRNTGSPMVERFLRDELGWEQFLFSTYMPSELPADPAIRRAVYLRCVPGEANPLYPEVGQFDALGSERCAPTIDDLRYETVSLDLAQIDQEGPDGIWVVTRWATGAPFAQVDPRVVEARAAALLEDFLEARLTGAGAEGMVDVSGMRVFGALQGVPLLYSTSTGAPYERYEIDVVGQPRWPYGDMDFSVRLFADGGETVVEQPVSWSSSRLSTDVTQATENGQPLPVTWSFFDGAATMMAASPWEGGFERNSLDLGGSSDEAIVLVNDPLPIGAGCGTGPTPANAAALAQALSADRDLQVTAPVAVSIGGAEGLAMDLTAAPGAGYCDELIPVLTIRDDAPWRGLYLDRGSRMRLYLVDLPGGVPSRILAIGIVAPEVRFEDVTGAAAPVVDSIEFRTP